LRINFSSNRPASNSNKNSALVINGPDGPKFDFRFTPESGLKSDIGACPFRADFVAEIGIPTARDGWCIF
jgi:hypothetical protein